MARFAVKWYDPIDGKPSLGRGRFDSPQQAADAAIATGLKYGDDSHWVVWNTDLNRAVPESDYSREGMY